MSYQSSCESSFPHLLSLQVNGELALLQIAAASFQGLFGTIRLWGLLSPLIGPSKYESNSWSLESVGSPLSSKFQHAGDHVRNYHGGGHARSSSHQQIHVVEDLGEDHMKRVWHCLQANKAAEKVRALDISKAAAGGGSALTAR